MTERTGEKTGHIMLARREFCKKCPPKHWSNARDFCARQHVSYRACSSCDYEQRDWHPCDHTVSSYVGNWPHYGPCDRKAVEARGEYSNLMGRRDKGKRWLCKRHFPENNEAREAEKNRKSEARWEARIESERMGWVGRGYEKILLQMAGWMAANPDLVAEDEWLGSIAKRMSDDEYLMKALEKNPEACSFLTKDADNISEGEDPRSSRGRNT